MQYQDDVQYQETENLTTENIVVLHREDLKFLFDEISAPKNAISGLPN